MPANYLQIVQKLPQHAHETAGFLQEREKQTQETAGKLYSLGLDLAELSAKIELALAVMPALYTARPFKEAFTTRGALPQAPEQYTLLGIDGSQIIPSRHQPIPFGLINLGWIGIEAGSGLTPWTNKLTEIIPYRELFTANGGLITDTEVDLRRDLAERELIPKLFAGESAELRIAVSDGPLEVHRSREDAQANPRIEARIAALDRELAHKRLVHAGYIDKPGSAMLSRMLAIGALEHVDAQSVNQALQKGLPVSDLELMQGFLRTPGQRSAVFEIVSKRPQRGNEPQNLPQRVFCFYLCVGLDDLNQSPVLARVEFARWVAEDSALVGALHAVVYADTQNTPAHPFPYVLTRAHEEAVIGLNEQFAIENMLKQAWHAAGMAYGSSSAKAHGKESLRG